MSCLAGVSTLLWQYIRQNSHWGKKALGAIVITALAIGVLVLYGLQFSHLTDRWLLVSEFYLSLGALSWLFSFFFAFPVLVVAALVVFVYKHVVKPPVPTQPGNASQGKHDLSRRTFLKGAIAAIPALSLGTSLWGNFVGEGSLSVTSHKLSFDRLPSYLKGYRLAQISDTHMGLFFSPERLKEAIDAAIQAKADRLVITGDLIDELSLLPQYEAILNESAGHFPDGIDFVYGNHEYYRGIMNIREMLERTPVRILRNSNYEAARGERPFYIAGVDYSFARNDEQFRSAREDFVEKALQGIPADAFVVLLAHHSAFIDEGFAHGINLTLCGHTHGGQVFLLEPLIHLFGFKYLRGLFTDGQHYGYVNRGTGHWLPLRLACSRELSIFEFTLPPL